MSQSIDSADDTQAEWMARLLIHGAEMGYTLEDERMSDLFATAIALDAKASAAIDPMESLYMQKEYGQAIKQLSDVIDIGERLFAQHPKSLAEEAYGYTLARLYHVRAAGWLGASGQNGGGAGQLQYALNDANKALSYPARYYEFLNPNFLEQAKLLKDSIQALLTNNQQSKMLKKKGSELAQQVNDFQAKLAAEEKAGLSSDAIITTSSGILVIERFFSQHEEALALEPEIEALFGAELVTFYGMRAVQYMRHNRWKDADKDVTKALNFPASYYKNPEFKTQLREMQVNIKKAKGGCFIATAAYGSPLAPEIIVLRRFRDTQMRPCRAGRRMIDVYEHYSPPLADAIAPHPTARLWVRRLLLAPVIAVIQRWFP